MRGGPGGVRPQAANAETFLPVVAVVDFENRANFNGQWNLGSGFADLLTSELLGSGKAVVLERRDIRDVLNELDRQQSDLFRSQGKARLSRLKNAEYLIRGTITDFTIIGDNSAWLGSRRFFLFGRKGTARVAMNIKISDVETGEILASLETAGTSASGELFASGRYENVAFGGRSFFKTPLGKATHEAMERAVRSVLGALPQKGWKPRIAEVSEDRVIINGGHNVRLKVGTRFLIRGPEELISDPVTGNIIERMPGEIRGIVVVSKVKASSAWAEIESGFATRGDVLEMSQFSQPLSIKPLGSQEPPSNPIDLPQASIPNGP